MTTRNTRPRIFLGASLAALLLSATFTPVIAQDFSPAVIVNDEIITGYDIDQRQRLLEAASGGESITREDAITQLVNDILRLQAARRAGISPSKEEIDRSFDELSRGQGRDPQTMRQYFRSRGVSEGHLEKQMAAEVAWRDLVPRTYMPRIRISDDELSEAMGTDKAAPTEPEYLLSEIRLPIDARGEQAVLAEANALLQQLRSGATFGDLARRRSAGLTAATGGDLGWVGLSTMTPVAQDIVGQMTKDRVTRPFVDGTDVLIVGVRDTRGLDGATPASYRISQLVVGVAPDAAAPAAALALQQAQAAKARVTDCASVEALKGEYLPISGDVGTLTPAQMPGPVREAVIAMPVGGISDPIRSNDGFHIIVLCDRIESGTASTPSGAEEDAMRRRLTASKLTRYSASLLRKLRREAVIERR
jgi:peptidyl-prolyl cis-trans isomerase SurA